MLKDAWKTAKDLGGKIFGGDKSAAKTMDRSNDATSSIGDVSGSGHTFNINQSHDLRAPEKSTLVRASSEDVAKFDPQTRAIIDAATEENRRIVIRTSTDILASRIHGGSFWLLVFLIALVIAAWLVFS